MENKEVYDSQGNAFDGTEVYHEGQGWTLAKLTKFTFVTDRKQKNSDFIIDRRCFNRRCSSFRFIFPTPS